MPTETDLKDAPDATQTKMAEPMPEGQLPATQAQQPSAAREKNLQSWEQFRNELNARADEIGSQLPPNLSREKFMNASIAAVKATPEILTATPRSLMSSLVKAAQDGLLPDGREGIITVYNVTGVGKVAQWNPMILGIRKRARELGNILIGAKIVYKADYFEYEEGDEPFIKHKPAPQAGDWVPATEAIYAYAIFRQQVGTDLVILHREVMSAAQIERTRAVSKAKDSLMWTGFWTEGWAKTVARRGSKSVPVSPELERLINRDDENFDFSEPAIARLTNSIAERLATGKAPEIVYTSGKKAPEIAPPAADQVQTDKPTSKLAEAAAASTAAPAGTTAKDMFEQSTIEEIKTALASATTNEGLALLADEWGSTTDLMTPESKALVKTLFAEASTRIDPPKAAKAK